MCVRNANLFNPDNGKGGKKMKEKRIKPVIVGFLSVLLLTTLLPLTVYEDVPQQINYQGYLEDSDGVPIDDTVDIEFSLYNVETEGTVLWTETQSVDVIGGIFSVTLGDVTPIDLAFDTQYYLGVKVGADDEMTPRQPLTSVGYAMRADSVSDRGITSMMIDHDAIDTEHISDDAVDTDQIADDAISSEFF